MQLTFSLLSSYILIQSALAAPMHNLATGVSAVAKTTYQTSACRYQSGSCSMRYKSHRSPKYMESEQMPMMMMPERHRYQMMEQPEDTSMEEDPTPMEMQSYKDTPMTMDMDMNMDMNMAMFGMQPKRALMDEMRGYSTQESGALSKSNQFDQAQHLDQTLYQPAQPVQSQVIIPQYFPRRCSRPYKKYSGYGCRHYKIRYYGRHGY
ncbi:hypothetical protein K493DRAFT_307623 [Basidiobolus meristosporus CBS 931.73]|uniref:C3H1-type domain-containing protein n=1 Tax=Basidiobolus meristosporus CBS 931.73 TaxID=1314790 RepID=A0A1Y1XCF6_9FUNG|nr:hypothetical protein K493DRAFT_307623 [Basidiobolus meristosporus CBS 931.73]|eukprot:ORX83405.1 hypothetical protein K493DRAFT_307623 [Basidiobolus meristosporus CBS 931.73]